MNKPPQNPNIDLSNNTLNFNITKDLSNNIFNFAPKNHLNKNNIIFNPLQRSSNINLVNSNLNNNDNNLNTNNNNYFNMRIKSLLDNLQNERTRIKNQYLLQLEDIKNGKDSQKYSKENMDHYLHNLLCWHMPIKNRMQKKVSL